MISGKKDGNISVEKQFVITGGSVGVTVIGRRNGHSEVRIWLAKYRA